MIVLRRARLWLGVLVAGSALVLSPTPLGHGRAAAAGGDPYCTGSYGSVPARAAARLRMGIDPGLAGSFGGQQLPSVADDPARDLAALRALRPARRVLVLRLNRLFWSDGAAGVRAFRGQALRYARAGFEVEIQVRYHPPSGSAGDIAGWRRFVRSVVDALGPNRAVVAMTITNEVNVTFSPNTSDGYYSGAQDALIAGVEAAHDEAARRGFRQLRFGFTYAYRFSPSGDASFFAYLGAHGGRRLVRSLGFVGLDFYPGTVYPPLAGPGEDYRADLAQAAGVLRSCLMPMAGLGAGVPIWITENGVPTGALSEAQQAAALTELVGAARDYGRSFAITDYRWFNLRDAQSSGPETLLGPTFASFGLLRADYTRKPSFAAFRAVVESDGTPAAPTRRRRRPRTRR